MASADSLLQSDPPGSPEDVYPLIERSFFGVGGVHSGNPVQAAFWHHFAARGGGSRISLTQTCASAFGMQKADVACLASAVECLHNASLVQDDLQDNSKFRRGQSSVAARFGRDVALGLTNQLITSAFVCLSGISDPTRLPFLISHIHRAVGETVDGQTRELSGSLHGRSLDAYLSAAKKKSGPLFALSLELPLIFTKHSEFVEIAHEAACQFGLGYQILDDLKDQKSDPRGKRSGNVVFALKKSNDSKNARTTAAIMAEYLLQEASERADSLPLGCGRPLIDLIGRLTAQINVFKS